jgi:hypothetical protein
MSGNHENSHLCEEGLLDDWVSEARFEVNHFFRRNRFSVIRLPQVTERSMSASLRTGSKAGTGGEAVKGTGVPSDISCRKEGRGRHIDVLGNSWDSRDLMNVT